MAAFLLFREIKKPLVLNEPAAAKLKPILAFLRWHYPTGSRGLPDCPFREFSAGSAPPANLIILYASPARLSMKVSEQSPLLPQNYSQEQTKAKILKLSSTTDKLNGVAL
jgi:hypothetical protein